MESSAPESIVRELRSWHAWAVLGLIAVGLALRFAGAGDHLLNPDEALAVLTASNATLAEIWTDGLPNLHPPANHFMLHFLLNFSREPLWLRLPSILLGTYLILAGYLFTKQLFGREAGVASTLLIAFSPNLIELSQVCRNYNPGLALLLTSLIFLIRYLREFRRRDLILYLLFEILASTWHYNFVVVFIASKIVLLGALFARRPSGREWIEVSALQLPLAALLAFFYFFHVRTWSSGMVEWYGTAMHDEFNFKPTAFLSPFIQLSRYLLGGILGKSLFYLAILGAAVLFINRRRLELALCALPLALAYAFFIAKQIPLGASRHGAYLLPFLFALIAAHIPQAITGYRETIDNLRKRFSPSTTSLTVPQPAKIASLAAAGILLMAFAIISLQSYFTHAPYTSQPEDPTSKEQLAATERNLRGRARDGDLVLVSYQAMMVLQCMWDKNAAAFAPEKTHRLHLDGIELIYVPACGWTMTAEAFLRAFDEIQSARTANPPENVWALRVAGDEWEGDLAKSLEELNGAAMQKQCVSDNVAIRFGSQAGLYRATGPCLYSLPWSEAAKLAAELPKTHDSDFREDFLRSQEDLLKKGSAESP
jgi:hypothetical protein